MEVQRSHVLVIYIKKLYYIKEKYVLIGSVQGVPRLSPEDCWDRLQPTRDPTKGLSGRKWMDGWIHRPLIGISTT